MTGQTPRPSPRLAGSERPTRLDPAGVAEALGTQVLQNIATLEPERVLRGQPNLDRASNRRSFPWVDFYGDEPTVGGLPGHRHKHCEIATVLDGRLNLGIGEHIYEAQQGDWLLFAPNVLHGECCLPHRSRYSLLWVTLRSSHKLACHTTRYTRKHGYELVASMLPEPVPRDLNEAAHELIARPWDPVAEVRPTLVRLVSWSLDRADEQSQRSNGGHPSVAEAVRIMCDRLDRPPTVVEIANHVGLSPNYLSSLFHQQTGRTVRRFMEQVRIEEARRLLADPPQNVKAVAYGLGFNDPQHFSRVFRRVTGESPSSAKQRALQQAEH